MITKEKSPMCVLSFVIMKLPRRPISRAADNSKKRLAAGAWPAQVCHLPLITARSGP
jgi:hypothetical protein